ncbi:MAG: arginase family protein [Candidatus Obscuribacterales bacterium]|nr:arginase family protein [Steroidobacteraceae bacterium]
MGPPGKHREYAIVEAPSPLGLRPTGVQDLASALVRAGLADRLNARRAGVVAPSVYSAHRDPATNFLNPAAVVQHAIQLSNSVKSVLERGEFPLVLGGDCSILLGNLLALKRRGRYGLLFIDGHTDFYQADANINGEIASSELAIATGRGPRVLTHIDGEGPLIRDQDVVAFAFRDEQEASKYGSQPLAPDITAIDLATIRSSGIEAATSQALSRLTSTTQGFWVHLDADALDDAIMPAVDYRLEGGLSWEELAVTLRMALATNHCVGLDVTIFNPHLDTDGAITRTFVDTLVEALKH